MYLDKKVYVGVYGAKKCPTGVQHPFLPLKTTLQWVFSPKETPLEDHFFLKKNRPAGPKRGGFLLH